MENQEIFKNMFVRYIDFYSPNEYYAILKGCSEKLAELICTALPKFVNCIVTISNLFNRRTKGELLWGYECEYDPRHYENYVWKYLLLHFIDYVLEGRTDGSGPREVSSPPMNVFTLNELKTFVTLLYLLDVSYESQAPYDPRISYGRHIHVNIFVDNEYSMYQKFARLVPILTPLMANTIQDQSFKYRERVKEFADAKLYYKYVIKSRAYMFVTWNEHGTFEIRLNEASPIEAWFVATTITILTKYGAKGLGKYRLSKMSIEKIITDGISFNDYLQSVTGNQFRLIEGFEALTNYVLDKLQAINKELYKLGKKIVQNVKNYRKVFTSQDIENLYPELLDQEVINEVNKEKVLVIE